MAVWKIFKIFYKNNISMLILSKSLNNSVYYTLFLHPHLYSLNEDFELSQDKSHNSTWSGVCIKRCVFTLLLALISMIDARQKATHWKVIVSVYYSMTHVSHHTFDFHWMYSWYDAARFTGCMFDVGVSNFFHWIQLLFIILARHLKEKTDRSSIAIILRICTRASISSFLSFSEGMSLLRY